MNTSINRKIINGRFELLGFRGAWIRARFNIVRFLPDFTEQASKEPKRYFYYLPVDVKAWHAEKYYFYLLMSAERTQKGLDPIADVLACFAVPKNSPDVEIRDLNR